MKYLCLVYLDEAHWDACPDRDCFEFASELAGSGKLVAAEPLHPAHTATTVRVRNGMATLFDGPFSETKELLAGFYLIEAADLNEALATAARIPPAKYGSIEVRPVRALDVPGYRSFSPEQTAAATNDTYLTIFLGSKTSPRAKAWMALPEAERRAKEQEGMAAWKGWVQQHQAVISAIGGPLGKTKRVTARGIEDVSNEMGAFVVVKAGSHEAAAKLFEKHPHFTVFPGEAVEIMPVLPIPGA